MSVAEGDVANFLLGVGWRALDHIVHQATGCAGACLHAAGTFEQLDALFVVHGNHGFRADGQAFALVVVAVVERETAHAQHVPISGRVVAVGDRCVQAQGVRDALRANVFQRGTVNGGGVEREFVCGHITKTRHARGQLVGDGDFGRVLLRPSGRARCNAQCNGRANARCFQEWRMVCHDVSLNV